MDDKLHKSVFISTLPSPEMQDRCGGGFEEYAAEFLEYLRSIEVRESYIWNSAVQS